MRILIIDLVGLNYIISEFMDLVMIGSYVMMYVKFLDIESNILLKVY